MKRSTFIDWRGFKAEPWNLPLKRPGVYRVVNLVNNKCYVGLSNNVASRLKSYSNGWADSKLKAALKKYGKANFAIEPVFYWSGTKSELDMKFLAGIETQFIIEYDSIRNGYNIIEKWHISSYPRSQETRNKTTEINKKAWADPELRQRRLENIKISLARPEVSKKKSEIMKEAHARPDSKARYEAGLIRSREQRARKVKEFWSTPEARARRKATTKEVANRPEVKAKQAENLKSRNLLTFLITDGKNNKRIPRTDPIPKGWRSGFVRRGNKSKSYRLLRLLRDGVETSIS